MADLNVVHSQSFPTLREHTETYFKGFVAPWTNRPLTRVQRHTLPTLVRGPAQRVVSCPLYHSLSQKNLPNNNISLHKAVKVGNG